MVKEGRSPSNGTGEPAGFLAHKAEFCLSRGEDKSEHQKQAVRDVKQDTEMREATGKGQPEAGKAVAKCSEQHSQDRKQRSCQTKDSSVNAHRVYTLPDLLHQNG
jgi:hypothetical protein